MLEKIADADGNACFIGTCGGGYVEVGTFRFGRDQAEEFARLFIAACWQAGEGP